MEIYIYKHTSPSGKCYIGQTTNPKNRWRSSAYKPCPKFYNAIQKYGWCNFTHEIIFKCHDEFEANRKEEYFIKKYNSATDGYNTLDVVEEIIDGTKEKLILCGHTHIPCGYQTNSGQTVVNVGSVGRPMTPEPKACYCVIDFTNGSFELHHRFVEYDNKLAAQLMSQRGFVGADRLADLLLNPAERHI
jgi:diadenosine tetraphosphatase ApaH/serine/threonine PP2A family protein phosphatase